MQGPNRTRHPSGVREQAVGSPAAGADYQPTEDSLWGRRSIERQFPGGTRVRIHPAQRPHPGVFGGMITQVNGGKQLRGHGRNALLSVRKGEDAVTAGIASGWCFVSKSGRWTGGSTALAGGPQRVKRLVESLGIHGHHARECQSQVFQDCLPTARGDFMIEDRIAPSLGGLSAI